MDRGQRQELAPFAGARGRRQARAELWAAHALIVGSRLEIFEGASHFPHAEY
jgi:hypothetical protein